MKLKIEYLPLKDIVPYAGNAKTHPAEQVEQIKESIKQFGFNDPIALWNGEIVEGHGRFIAASELGIDTVPVIRLDGLTDEQRRAYGLVHNKLTMNSGFDAELLALEIDAIKDIDLGDFGFEVKDIEEDLDDIESEPGFSYKEQYGVIVMCADEAEQEQIYDRLTSEGFNCRVVAT